MTDPVPYEPAENIPPIILPGITPDPHRLHIIPNTSEQRVTDISLSVPVLEYNLDDTLYFKLLWDNCEDMGGLRDTSISSPPPAVRSRTRTFTYVLNLGSTPLATTGTESPPKCARLVLAVSDRGWSSDTPPYCNPPKDANGEDLTVVSIAQWWFLVDNGTIADGSGVKTCGDWTTPLPD